LTEPDSYGEQLDRTERNSNEEVTLAVTDVVKTSDSNKGHPYSSMNMKMLKCLTSESL
jgi:hypothetical protein